eukprot:scaffold5114_cov67-Cylindrotheca_fusiformis.AAC.14
MKGMKVVLWNSIEINARDKNNWREGISVGIQIQACVLLDIRDPIGRSERHARLGRSGVGMTCATPIFSMIRRVAIVALYVECFVSLPFNGLQEKYHTEEPSKKRQSRILGQWTMMAYNYYCAASIAAVSNPS